VTVAAGLARMTALAFAMGMIAMGVVAASMCAVSVAMFTLAARAVTVFVITRAVTSLVIAASPVLVSAVTVAMTPVPTLLFVMAVAVTAVTNVRTMTTMTSMTAMTVTTMTVTTVTGRHVVGAGVVHPVPATMTPSRVTVAMRVPATMTALLAFVPWRWCRLVATAAARDGRQFVQVEFAKNKVAIVDDGHDALLETNG
jgi:hypothetical protein